MRNAIVGGPFGSDLVSRDYVDAGVPVIRGTNMGNRWVEGDFAFVSRAKSESLAANHAEPGDIVFTQRGTLGQVALVPMRPYERYLISQSQMKLTVDRRKALPLFLYYVFRSDEQQEYIRKNAIQTGVPHTNLGLLKATPLQLPPLAEQRTIAHILGTLDDKIELNRRMNETLEAMARALFKSWFVDFDPVRANADGRAPSGMDAETAKLFPSAFVESELGLIPRGWSIQPLDEIADFRNGLALQKFRPKGNDPRLPVVKIAQLRTGQPGSDEWARADITPECILENGDVVFSWSGSLAVVVWCGGRAALNQHLFRLTSQSYPKSFYLHWLVEHLPEFQRIAGDKATTMGHIQRHHLTAAKCVVPSASVLSAASRVLEPILHKQIALDLESRTLARMRDELLPRLLSGEISVADAEHTLEVP
ncbi:MAG: restriction endonuclease subunit S [Polyangiaceae bacterium]|nr:restriction endonuclease subunit S [Polyangiaceae bacterium]